MQVAKDEHVQYAYDAISDKGSVLLLSRVLSKVSPTGKGKVTLTGMFSDDEHKQLPEGIEVERTSVATAYGEDEECEALSCEPKRWS